MRQSGGAIRPIEEMMVGFFDVAVPAKMDKQQFFVRQPGLPLELSSGFCLPDSTCPDQSLSLWRGQQIRLSK